MQQSNKPFQTQVIYLFAILCGVLGAFLFLYSMSERNQGDSTKSISSPAPISEVEKPVEAKTAEAIGHEKTARSPAAKSLIETLTALDSDARWEITEHTDGRPSHILGGRIRCPDRECNSKSATQILKTIAAALDVKGENLRQTQISVGSNSYTLEQFYGKYRVFNSSIKAYANSGNTEIYHVLNELRRIDTAETAEKISTDDARSRFAQHFGIEDESKITFVYPEPVVYGSDPTHNSLVWWMTYGQRGPVRRSIDAFVNATTGAITVRTDTR